MAYRTYEVDVRSCVDGYQPKFIVDNGKNVLKMSHFNCPILI